MTRPHVRDLLAFVGRNGPLMLFAGLLIGLIAPPLAEAARPALGSGSDILAGFIGPIRKRVRKRLQHAGPAR